MKRNIILLYLIYGCIIYLLLLIDIGVLMYYIFWINNIFFYPFFWLWIKIIYFNRTILLLLLFYYFIAKFTIKEIGYKYYFFFNIDIRKWRSIYLNYIWNITTYHIELVSIYLFFFVITLPLLLYKKEVYFFLCFLIIFFFLLVRIALNRLYYIRNKKQKKNWKSIIFSFVLMIFFIKFLNYSHIKDLLTLYIHLDIWVFDLLSSKIRMYEKSTEKDYFSKMVGLKPIWFSEKIIKKEFINKKYWDYLYKKKKKFLVKELKFKIKKKEKKYYLSTKYLFTKYLFKILELKKKQLYNLKKYYVNKNFKYKDKDYAIKTKEFSWRKIIKNENPVVELEKRKERELHRLVLSNKIFKFSLNNYYFLNAVLKKYTLNKLYYHSFLEKKNYAKYFKNEKKHNLQKSLKDRIYMKDDFNFYKKVMNKIKINKKFLMKKNIKYNNNNGELSVNKLLNYIMNEEKKDSSNLKNYIIKIFKFKNKKMIKRKEKFNMNVFLKKTNNEMDYKKKTNVFSFFFDSRKYIINNDMLKEKNRGPSTLSSNYVNRSELERFDNKLIFNAVNKYNEENEAKIKKGFKSEFSNVYVKKEKKGNLNTFDSSKKK